MSHRGRRARERRGKITWLEKPAVPPAPFMQNIAAYGDNRNPPSEEFQAYLEPGTLWLTRRPMSIDPRQSDSQHTVLNHTYLAQGATVQVGTPMVYSGEVRADQRLNNGRTVNVPLPTFIVCGNRYVINDFACIVPLELHVRNMAAAANHP